MALPAQPPPPASREQRHQMIFPWVAPAVVTLLEREAERRGCHRDQLAARLLTYIAADDLFEVVLDGEQKKR